MRGGWGRRMQEPGCGYGEVRPWRPRVGAGLQHRFEGEKGGIVGDAHHGVDGALGEAGKGLTAMDLTKASGVPRLKKMSGW